MENNILIQTQNPFAPIQERGTEENDSNGLWIIALLVLIVVGTIIFLKMKQSAN